MPATDARRTRDAERSRRVILDAAEALFAERGYRGTSLQDIGEVAGVSRGTPSYFFGSKAGVYRAVLERNFAQVGQLLREIREGAVARGAGPEEVLAHEVEAYLDFLVAHPTFVRLVQWEGITGGEVLGEYAPRLGLLTEALDVVREEVERGRFREIDARFVLLSVMALCWFPLTESGTVLRLLDLEPSEPQFLRQWKQHVAELILHGICLPPSEA